MTDRRLIDDLNRVITHPPRAREPLPPAAGQAAIPGVGRGERSPAGGGGIASPLTEIDYADRQWHPEIAVASSDGVFVLMIEPIKQVTFRDAQGKTAAVIFEPPP
ncbi:MAG: hypothetical protein AB7U25_26125 [Vicinamibacterales bacterium]